MRNRPFSRLAWLGLRVLGALALTFAPWHVTFDGAPRITAATADAGNGNSGGNGSGGNSGSAGGSNGGNSGNSNAGGNSGNSNTLIGCMFLFFLLGLGFIIYAGM